MAKKNVIKELQQSENEYLMNDINTFYYKRKKVSFKYGIIDIKNATIKSVEEFYKQILSKDIIVGVSCHNNYKNNINKLLIKYFDKKIIKVKDNLTNSFKAYYPQKNIIIKHFKPIKSIMIIIIIPINLIKYTKDIIV